MLKKWLDRLNLVVSCLAILFFCIGGLFILLNSSELSVSETVAPLSKLPKGGFSQTPEAYNAIGDPFLKLHFSPMSTQLPDLKKHLIYYGKNGRPDAIADQTHLHFAFVGNKSVTPIPPNERFYIAYDWRNAPPQYIFSNQNAPTPLWIEAEHDRGDAAIKVTMLGENGDEICEPKQNANFTLSEKEFIRTGASTWEIGKNRVDATLLARQRARWYGVDQFLVKHGGDEFREIANKQRIDFGEGEESYCVYVGANDTLIWDKERWNGVKPGRNSIGKPLMVVKKLEERLMTLELWDPEGKGKVNLNLLKSTDPQAPVNVAQTFKFFGARTRTQFVFEINKERVLLSPKDWLVQTKTGWIKLVTPQEIDNFVDRKLIGPLFVFDAVERRDDKQYLKGTLFNSSRTDMHEVEIPLQQSQKGKKNGTVTKKIPIPAEKTEGKKEFRCLTPQDEDDFDDSSAMDFDDEEEEADSFFDGFDDDDDLNDDCLDDDDFDDEDLEE